MRFARVAALVGVALLWWAFGPVVLLVALGSLCWWRVRAWLRPTRRVVVWSVVAALAVAGLAWVVPDGWVRIPPGAGALATPAYVGRPAIATGKVVAPLGESPTVTTRAYGTPGCRELGFDSHGRVVTACGGSDAPVLRLLDPDSLRQLADKELPAGCAPVVAVTGDRALVAAGDDRLLVVATADAEGEPDLTTAATVDLPDAGCLTGVGVDEHGRVWFSTTEGVVGLVLDGRVRTLDLDDEVERPLAVASDAVYVAGSQALHKVIATQGRPVPAWASAYDGGERGSAPVVLPAGLVAVADDRDPRLQVVLHRGDTGEVACRVELFDDDESATDGGMVGAGDGLLVLNSHGYSGPWSTAFGRTTTGGIARVDDDCTVTWTSDLDAPSGAPAVSTDAGLAYVYTKRHSWLGVNAWYLTAVALDSGRAVWARRTGLGMLADNHHGAVALGPDGPAYVPVLGGFVRVADRD